MENLTAQLSKHADRIDVALETAENTKPEFYAMVCENPSIKSVNKLLKGIVNDFELVTLITKYLIFIK